MQRRIEGTAFVLVISHRGYHADVPENTLAAFDRAVAMGVDGIETDVRLTADGIAVLFHDRCVGRGRHRVAELTHRELEAAAGYAVPTVESALAEWEGPLWNLEIKTAAAVPPVVDLVRRFGAARRLLVTSFLHPVVYEVVALTGVAGGLLLAHAPLDPDKYFLGHRGLDPSIRTMVWDYEICSPALLAASAAQGFENLVYGAVTRGEHQDLKPWQVQGVITDEPAYVQEDQAERGST